MRMKKATKPTTKMENTPQRIVLTMRFVSGFIRFLLQHAKMRVQCIYCAIL